MHGVEQPKKSEKGTEFIGRPRRRCAFHRYGAPRGTLLVHRRTHFRNTEVLPSQARVIEVTGPDSGGGRTVGFTDPAGIARAVVAGRVPESVPSACAITVAKTR